MAKKEKKASKGKNNMGICSWIGKRKQQDAHDISIQELSCEDKKKLLQSQGQHFRRNIEPH